MSNPVEPLNGPAQLRGLAIDIDGTLLRSDHRLSNAVCKSIRAIARFGLPVVLVSGRPPRSILSIAGELQTGGPMVALNGALALTGDGDTISTHRIGQDALSNLVPLISWYEPLTAHYFNERDWLTLQDNEAIRNETAILGFAPTLVSDRKRITDINKIMVVGDATALRALTVEITAQGWPVTLTLSKPTYLEITHSGVTKGTGLRCVADVYGLAVEDFTAFGDGDNDIPLFEVCGYGVAMGNASDGLKKAADIVIGSNDDNALAAYIDEVLLPQIPL